MIGKTNTSPYCFDKKLSEMQNPDKTKYTQLSLPFKQNNKASSENNTTNGSKTM